MRHYMWVFLEKIGVVILKVISISLLARVIGPDDFGLYAMVAVVVAIASMLVDSGMGGSLIRKQNLLEIDYSTVFIFNLFVSFSLYGVIFLISPYVAKFYEQESIDLVLKLLAIVLIIRSFGMVHAVRLTRDLDFKPQTFIYVFSTAASLCAAYLLAIGGWGVWALVAQQIVEAILVVLGMVLWTKYMPRFQFSIRILREHFAFGSRLVLSSVMAVIGGNVATVVVGKSLGVSSTGYYSQANKVNDVFIGLMSTIIDKASFPLMVKRAGCDTEFSKYIISLLGGVCFVSFFIVAVVFSSANHLVDFLLGPDWGESAWMLQIIALSGYGMTYDVIARNVLKTMGRVDMVLRLSVIKAVFAIVTVIVASMFGLIAVVWAVVIGSVFNAAVSFVVLGKVTSVTYRSQFMVLLKPLAASAILVGLFGIIKPEIGGSAVASLLFITVSGLVVYSFVAYILKIDELTIVVRYLMEKVVQAGWAR